MKTKQTRREEAASRFRILPFVRWCKDRGRGGHVDKHRDDYDGYLARKGVEATALGIK